MDGREGDLGLAANRRRDSPRDGCLRVLGIEASDFLSKVGPVLKVARQTPSSSTERMWTRMRTYFHAMRARWCLGAVIEALDGASTYKTSGCPLLDATFLIPHESNHAVRHVKQRLELQSEYYMNLGQEASPKRLVSKVNRTPPLTRRSTGSSHSGRGVASV